MEIKRGNTVVCDVYLKDNSYTVEEIMGEDTLTLNFLSRNVVNLQINDYIDFEGTKYKIRHNEKVTKRRHLLVGNIPFSSIQVGTTFWMQSFSFMVHRSGKRTSTITPVPPVTG